MIDLHLHTTASDGLLTPESLIARAAGARLTVVSITDHDTVAGIAPGRAAAEALGLRLVTGIEITAVEGDRDVHVLGYFFDPGDAGLAAFLAAQRRDRVRRVEEMGARLGELGLAVDVSDLIARAAAAGSSIGRPAIADALVAAGHVANRGEAFERWLGRGRPAFVARRGATGGEVIGVIQGAGGLASLAHPGLLGADELIPALAAAGLDAIEVWHSDHSPVHQAHYAALADRFSLRRSGGSDFHGDGVHRTSELGSVSLPADEFARLESGVR